MILIYSLLFVCIFCVSSFGINGILASQKGRGASKVFKQNCHIYILEEVLRMNANYVSFLGGCFTASQPEGRGEGKGGRFSLSPGAVCGDLSWTIRGETAASPGPTKSLLMLKTLTFEQISAGAFPPWKFPVVNHIDFNLKCQKGCPGVWEPTS